MRNTKVMEIKDAISLYTFLGQLGLWGAIALSVIIIVIITYLIVSIVEKITDNLSLRKKIVLLTVGILIICMSILITNSLNNSSYNADATAIKAYMISMKWKWLGYRKLAKEVHFPDMPALGNDTNIEKMNARVNYIKKVISRFPNEFEITSVIDDVAKDSLGIELIDTSAINDITKYYDEMLPFFKAELIQYIQANQLGELSYSDAVNKVDGRLQPYLIDKVIAKFNDTFIPRNSQSDSFIILIPGYKK